MESTLTFFLLLVALALLFALAELRATRRQVEQLQRDLHSAHWIIEQQQSVLGDLDYRETWRDWVSRN